jgi:hypothetical protein
MRYLTLGNALWLFAYLIVLSVTVGWMFEVRRRTMSALDSETAVQDWERWREEAARQASGEGTVQRRIPKSSEPPGLVLMRDHFAVCLGGIAFFTSAIFVSAMLFVRGALKTRTADIAWADPSERCPDDP